MIEVGATGVVTMNMVIGLVLFGVLWRPVMALAVALFCITLRTVFVRLIQTSGLHQYVFTL